VVSGAEQRGGLGMIGFRSAFSIVSRKFWNSRNGHIDVGVPKFLIIFAISLLGLFTSGRSNADKIQTGTGIPEIDFSVGCVSGNSDGDELKTFTMCKEQASTDRKWITQHWTYTSEGARADCTNAFRDYSRIARCLGARLELDKLSSDVSSEISTRFPYALNSQDLIGCWGTDFAAPFEQTWCFDKHGSLHVSEYADGHSASWSGSWTFPFSRTLSYQAQGSAYPRNCTARLSSDLNSFVLTSCSQDPENRNYFAGIFRRKTTDVPH
jgi:hypothetical protein